MHSSSNTTNLKMKDDHFAHYCFDLIVINLNVLFQVLGAGYYEYQFIVDG